MVGYARLYSNVSRYKVSDYSVQRDECRHYIYMYMYICGRGKLGTAE